MSQQYKITYSSLRKGRKILGEKLKAPFLVHARAHFCIGSKVPGLLVFCPANERQKLTWHSWIYFLGTIQCCVTSCGETGNSQNERQQSRCIVGNTAGVLRACLLLMQGRNCAKAGGECLIAKEWSLSSHLALWLEVTSEGFHFTVSLCAGAVRSCLLLPRHIHELMAFLSIWAAHRDNRHKF